MGELEQHLASCQLGNAFEIAEGATLANRSLARVEVPQHLARAFVVTLGSPPVAVRSTGVGAPSGAVPTGIGNAFAVVRWGVGGFQQEVEIDWRQGGVYAFYGAFVDVSVNVPTPVPVMNTGDPGAGFLRLGASITPAEGQSSSLDKATRTVPYATVAAGVGNVGDGAVPRFARTLRFMRQSIGATDSYTLQFTTVVAGAFVAQQSFRFANSGSRNNGDYAQPIPVPPSAQGLRIFNDSGLVGVTNPLCLYELAL